MTKARRLTLAAAERFARQMRDELAGVVVALHTSQMDLCDRLARVRDLERRLSECLGGRQKPADTQHPPDRKRRD